MGQAPADMRKPLGRQAWQRVLTCVLLALSIGGIAGAFMLGPYPLMIAVEWRPGSGMSFEVASVFMAGAYLQGVVIAVTWAVSIWFLAVGWPAFYVPIAGGWLAAVFYWMTPILLPRYSWAH